MDCSRLSPSTLSLTEYVKRSNTKVAVNHFINVTGCLKTNRVTVFVINEIRFNETIVCCFMSNVQSGSMKNMHLVFLFSLDLKAKNARIRGACF